MAITTTSSSVAEKIVYDLDSVKTAYGLNWRERPAWVVASASRGDVTVEVATAGDLCGLFNPNNLMEQWTGTSQFSLRRPTLKGTLAAYRTYLKARLEDVEALEARDKRCRELHKYLVDKYGDSYETQQLYYSMCGEEDN
jgi:hypothetical protein